MSDEISVAVIASMIFKIRGERVMLDSDLAKLYDVETKHLNRQVRRNICQENSNCFQFSLAPQPPAVQAGVLNGWRIQA